MNQRLKNAKMDKKFKTSFTAMNVGLIVTVIIAIVNIVLQMTDSSSAGVAMRRGIIAIVILIIATMLNLSLSSVVAKSLATAIVEPIREIQEAIRKLKTGKFDIEITYDGKDELAELADDLKETSGYLHEVVEDAGCMLGEMAEGRFNVSSSTRGSYVGDFETLILAMDKLNGQLSGTLHQIKEAAGQVMMGSEQLAGSARDLADGATNQASAIEELTATIESVTNIAEESAENAKTAATNAKEAAEDAKKSREEITQLTDAMNRITETSKEIEEIIATIEDIASQTNLLSLNASIEAARAGEAGKGFAVVADQIGKLATDSAHSAVSTRALISKSLEEIEEGNRIVDDTMEVIGTVLENMEQIAKMASGAAEASRVQADMLGQIEEGIEQITSVVQNNSASAQETSAVSQELSAQSMGLEEMVGQFVLE